MMGVSDQELQPIEGDGTSSVVSTPSSPVATGSRGLEAFEQDLLTRLTHAGLPTAGVLVNISERGRLLRNVDAALDRLTSEQINASFYVSKMLAAASAGLFDAALNYLWDETVTELRRRVAGYDLAYFFDLAVRSPDRRKGLSTEDDLRRVDDADLMRAAKEIGLISDVGYAQLDHIRYMRNYASAAHPNQIELTGLQLADWLETCIREVITLPWGTVVAEIRKLLSNIKTVRLTGQDVSNAATFFHDLPREQANTLAAGLFGIYTDTSSGPSTSDNVRALWPELWSYVSDDARFSFGTRYGRFLANADQAQAAAARELLDLVDAAAYFPEAVRAGELDAALGDLLLAHNAFNNFYTEPALARILEDLVGSHGTVPTPVQGRHVDTIVEVFLTNGHGIAWEADPIYRRLIERFDVPQASRALRSFTGTVIASKLQSSRGEQQWKELLDLLEPKLTVRRDRELLAGLRAFTGPTAQLRNDSHMQQLLEAA